VILLIYITTAVICPLSVTRVTSENIQTFLIARASIRHLALDCLAGE